MKRKVGTAVVVGAGIAGIRAALDLAETGYGVTLVDQAPHLGGLLSRLDHQFPTDHCGMCRLLPLVRRDEGAQHCLRRGLFHENIDLMLASTVTGIEGGPGKFRLTLKQRPSWIDPGLCVGCGRCVAACPAEVADDFNAGLSTRKAVYLPVPHGMPNSYVIDAAACTRCGACLAVCPTGAIRLPEPERRQCRILVVDDELAVRDSLREWLEAEGFDASMAASGAEALEALKAGTYHLMLLDIKMPGMDGVEVLQAAKAISPELAVIMMTAYATVETAVEAMKIGAMDYLIKPFEIDSLLPKVAQVYRKLESAGERQLSAGAVVLCAGAGFYDPAEGRNTLGYGSSPDILTQVEFERLLSAAGPTGGRLVRPSDGRSPRRIAWIQCVGSRDIQREADFCSNFCCMASIKEAVLARQRCGSDLEAVIFYMDLRTFGRSFQRYRDQAEQVHGVRFERARPHTVVADPAGGGLDIRWASLSGSARSEPFDMVVLAAGQRPAAVSGQLASLLDLGLNAWGFIETEPFALSRTRRPGIFVGGAFGGMKDIGEAVIQASSAALGASRAIHAAGGSLALSEAAAPPAVELLREAPRILAAVCRCGRAAGGAAIPIEHFRSLLADPEVVALEVVPDACTQAGRERLAARVREHSANRLLIGACLPQRHGRTFKKMARELGIPAGLVEAVDIAAWSAGTEAGAAAGVLARLKAGAARLKWADPAPAADIRIAPRALVVGGGIAGMSAALAIADHGYEVDLIESGQRLGGNLAWLSGTLEGHDAGALLADCLKCIEAQPRIGVHLDARIVQASGEVGAFTSVIEGPEGQVSTISHGVVILATGGHEAQTQSYGCGSGPGIVTQSELERRLAAGRLDADGLETVVMIQCVDSRREPRNYCSRVCCGTSLKHALAMKEKNPAVQIYVLYRDLMAYGFAEAAFTRARRAGVVFIPYHPEQPPRVTPAGSGATVALADPILGRPLEIQAQLVVLATGIVPALSTELAAAYGANLDQDGFFQEADSKWRPVDGLKEGVFACGLSLAPHTIAESVATAEAAAQRALRILARERLEVATVTAGVRRSLCSLCEQCIAACPYGARSLDAEGGQMLVNPARCQGCGACAAACPNDAAYVEGFAAAQMLSVIDAAIG